MNAVNLRVAEKYVEAISGLARTNNTLIVPANVGDLAGLVATAMQVVRAAPGSGGPATPGGVGQAPPRA